MNTLITSVTRCQIKDLFVYCTSLRCILYIQYDTMILQNLSELVEDQEALEDCLLKLLQRCDGKEKW